MCGSKDLRRGSDSDQSRLVQVSSSTDHARKNAIAVLMVSIAMLASGVILVLLPTTPDLIAVGDLLLLVGTIALLIPLGVSRTRYRSRVLNRFEQQRKERERKRHSD